MRKISLISIVMLMVSITTSAGGYLTNTNQHVSFLRMIARGASIDIDGVYSNPAGLSFLPKDGLYMSVNFQSAYQTRLIDATFPLFPEEGNTRHYKGTASAPVIPSLQAAYKNGKWVISGSFAIVGGGGKASFNNGLPMFDAMVMSGIRQQSGGLLTLQMYSINSAMDGRQYIFGTQLGASYLITDRISVFAGGRMNYFSGGYEGFLTAARKDNGTVLSSIKLDCDQTGWGVTPILGADMKFGKLNIGLKYEFLTKLNIENDTHKNVVNGTEGALEAYRNGVNTPNDIPALLTVAAGYEILPTLRASVEYHHFFDKQAGMAGDKQKTLTRGTHEYLAGVEWDVTKRFSLSAGVQRTDYGLSDDFQSDTSFSCDSYSVGLGGKVNLSEKLALNVAYFWTDYSKYTKQTATMTSVYDRTNKVFGVGVDYRF